ncbi:MAG: septum formation protein Maf [Planctomycetes bacterium]|nr:septum formation protein Maf [Planctomycetota bacterium]
MAPLLLASTSPYRRALLQRFGLPFEAVAPGVDEDVVKRAGGAPATIVRELARRKAQAVAAGRPGAVVIGSDQAVAVDGAVLDKPGSAAKAVAQLEHLQGRDHELLTAVAIVHPGGVVEFVDAARLWMRALSREAIARYVAAEQPFDCAGSYKVEGLGITLFERIDGADHTAIEGLPLLRLAHELRGLGFPLP